MTELIITTPYQLKQVVEDAVASALAAQQPTTKPTERKAIRSIREGAEFLGCSNPKFQKLKNSGSIRKYQTGRKFIIWTDELLEDIAVIKK